MGTAKTTTKAKCAYCGKEIVVRDIRDKGPYFCSRVCESMSRYMKRYAGPRSGKSDRPRFNKKGEKVIKH